MGEGAKSVLSHGGQPHVVFLGQRLRPPHSEPDTTDSAAGLALIWMRDGAEYGVTHVELEEHLSAGRRCVVDADDSFLDEWIEKFESDTCEVCFVSSSLIDDHVPTQPHVLRIRDEGSESVQILANALAGTLKFSIWLAPERGSDFETTAQGVISNLARSCGSRPFAPHLTLCPSFVGPQREAVRKATKIWRRLRPMRCLFGSMSTSEKIFRALVLEVEPSEELTRAHTTACSTVNVTQDSYAPHVSLLYGSHSSETLTAARCSATEMLTETRDFEATRLVLVVTSTPAFWCWHEVMSVDLELSVA